MDIFGDHWEDHFGRISEDWRARVTPEDTVLIPGDISWAMQLAAAKPDLDAIGALPGRKVLIRGNHDYWWSGITQVRCNLPKGMYALQNDALDLGFCVVCGSRGWSFPTPETPLSPEDDKIYRRELLRVEGGRLPLGILEGVRPSVTRVRLRPGDLLVMGSDGVMEAGDALMIERLVRTGAQKPPEQMAGELVREAGLRRAGERRDDLTCICTRLWDEKRARNAATG